MWSFEWFLKWTVILIQKRSNIIQNGFLVLLYLLKMVSIDSLPKFFLIKGGVITFQIWLKILKRAYFDFKILALIKGGLFRWGFIRRSSEYVFSKVTLYFVPKIWQGVPLVIFTDLLFTMKAFFEWLFLFFLQFFFAIFFCWGTI